MKKLSFIIPCYGSESTIEIVVNEILQTLQTRPAYDYEIILVNDCSLDDDGQTPADEFFTLVDKIEEGWDVVIASYSHKMHNSFRNFGTWMNNKMTEVLLKSKRKIIRRLALPQNSVHNDH